MARSAVSMLRAKPLTARSSSLQFNGSTSQALFGNIFNYTDKVSMMITFQLLSGLDLNNFPVLFAKGDVAQYYLLLNSNATVTFAIKSGTVEKKSGNSSKPLTYNKWYTLVGTYDKDAGANNTTHSLFDTESGTLIETKSSTQTGAIDTSSVQMSIGYSPTRGHHANVRTSDAWVFNRVLSVSEVTDYIRTRVLDTTSLGDHWVMQDGSGTNIDSDNGNDGTAASVTWSATVPPVQAPRSTAGNRQRVQGLNLNGTTAYVSTGTMGSYGSAIGAANSFYFDVTFSTSSTAAQSPFGFINAGSTDVVEFSINRDNVGASVGQMRLIVRNAAGATYQAILTSTFNWSDGIPHRVVGTLIPSTNTLTLTIDGVSKSLNVTTSGTPTGLANFPIAMVFGARNNNGSISQFWNGTIYYLKLGTTSSAIFGDYQLRDGAGTSATDSSGQANTGTLSGSPLPTWIIRTAA